MKEGSRAMSVKVAVVGATGNVGREILTILDEREFPATTVVALASTKSAGKEASFGDKTLKVRSLETFDFSTVDIALFSAGGGIALKWAPLAAKAGCVVIDNSSAFRMDPDVPLIVPEVNSTSISGYNKRNIIANPNCSTAQLVVALKPLHERAKIRRVVVATYQSASGAGREAMDELFNQTKNIYSNNQPKPREFTKQIAFNAKPHIDSFLENGTTKEEQKNHDEIKKILD